MEKKVCMFAFCALEINRQLINQSAVLVLSHTYTVYRDFTSYFLNIHGDVMFKIPQLFT